MSVPFFGKFGDEITFTHKDDLKYKFSQIDCTVPLRIKGRKAYHRERYCLKIYMEQLADTKIFKYPVTIRKHETPDFIITQKSQSTIGLEHTEATTEPFQQTSADFERSPDGSLLEVGYFSDPNLTREEYKRAIKKPGQKLDGPPSYGNAWEKEWTSIITTAFINKIIKLNRPNYTLCDRNELLIYNNTHVMANMEIALPLLKSKLILLLAPSPREKVFNVISVINDIDLYYDILCGQGKP